MNATRSQIHLYAKQKRTTIRRASKVVVKHAKSSSSSSSSDSAVDLSKGSPGGSAIIQRRPFLPACGTESGKKAGPPLQPVVAATPMCEAYQAPDAASLISSLKNRRHLRRRLQEHAAQLREAHASEALQLSQLVEKEQREASKAARLQRRAEIICLNNIMRHLEEQSWWRGRQQSGDQAGSNGV
ncbi:hypothetical protein HDU90_007288 [Geranomyces variabilis]|nr:hypothetical protein HDU90_007288 [Geranomyces variabilis]